MRVRSTILAAVFTASVLALGAGTAAADGGPGYDHEGKGGAFSNVGGPLGITEGVGFSYDHEGTFGHHR
ncbi:hypothetical protein ABT390_30655 [Streptomyces aurantiacus]|uniref:Uncharacterized protein n=1 Tax=Streptomyces aurantiacus JA 4570 TaxID=1286094 RepID=S4A1S3_9ACTN|nr:hypothetical protein [Streptomyces aurantiacus]EPH44650.1 hypothetical protein STRAU_2208 [Streptomyces aurantiacus JA 4570]